jgi:hypothetical protein
MRPNLPFRTIEEQAAAFGIADKWLKISGYPINNTDAPTRRPYETHYLRKWVDKDLNDLKNLIKLTMQ